MSRFISNQRREDEALDNLIVREGLRVDSINESTVNNGVTIEEVLIKDGKISSQFIDPSPIGLSGFPPVTDNAVVRWDGTTGDAIQNSGVNIHDNGDLNLTAPNSTIGFSERRILIEGNYPNAPHTSNTFGNDSILMGFGLKEYASNSVVLGVNSGGRGGNNVILGVNNGGPTFAGASQVIIGTDCATEVLGSSSSNVMIGSRAGAYGGITTGDNNIAIGSTAQGGSTYTDGTQNYCITLGAISVCGGGDYNIVMGYGSRVLGTRCMAFGGGPGSLRNVISPGGVDCILMGTGNLIGSNCTNCYMMGANILGFSNMNNVIAIGEGITVSGTNKIVLGNSSITNFSCNVPLTVTSDQRDKAFITDFPEGSGMDIINQFRPVTYRADPRERYDNNVSDGTHADEDTRIGLIAQEVKTVIDSSPISDVCSIVCEQMPEDEEGNGRLGVTYSALVPVLIQGMKEMSAEIESLKARISVLENP